MEENSKVYRIRTKVGEDSPNVIHVPINQTYDTFEILSLKLNQTDTYKTYESGYGIIVGRVIANGGFGVPNSKVSVFIEVDDNESLKDTLLYNFTSTSDTDNNGVRYNLLPDYVESECHQDVGTFPNKRLVLDNDDVIEIFDKYWKYTTTTNNSGDYMLFGVPTGSQQLHVDIDLSDCGVLSQRPHNMIGKGYNIGMFESPNKFKSSTNLNSLPQIVTEDRGVYVYPYWGDTSNGDNTFAITRCDINIEYKFEPTAVFMGSIITDKGSNAIGKNCTATINNGKMSELVTGEGTIEMIRKTIDGRVEQFPIMGNRVIDGDGTWVYEIPMNLDYVTTDEFGNFVPTDNPDKGIATRARVRFRVRLDDTQYDNTARKRACYLIPNNPRLEDEGFDKTMEVDYEFGSLTREESYRDLFWNKVYTVKNYIPKIQKGDEQYNRQHTGIKWVNHANHNNPMPYNTLTVKLSFVHRIICILTGLVVQFVAFINQIISLLGFLFATLFDLPSVLFNGIAKLLEDRICLPWPLDDVCVGDLLALIFRGIGKGASSINILGKMATKLLTPTCIVLDSGFCDDNVNKVDFYPGCGYFLFNLFPLSSATDVIERGDIAWEKTQEAHQEEYNGKSSDEVRTASNHTGKLHNCYENALAQENEATSFNFNNDWINGTLYAPLWYRKITPKKRFLFGLFTRKAKDEWCTSKQYFASLRYIQHCAVERDGSKTITNFDGDTTDLKFIRNSECVDGDCHERHVALPGLGGVIHSKKTMLGQDVYYYKPVEWSANLPSNELYTGKKKGELKLLFATDIVLLGSLDSCDMNGVPQFFKNLESTTYNMPGDILFTDYEFHYVIDPETGNATSNYNTRDYTVHSEMAGCDWGNPNEFNQKDGGLFYGIGCTNGETELKAKSCVNLSRICEYGVSLDVTKQIPIINNENIGNWKDASESEIEQAEDGTYYKRLITDGFISWDELYNLDERSMFATMNGNQLKTKINTNNGLKEYDFRYLYPENFDGSLAERMKRQTQNYSPEINYKFNYLLEKASRDYYLFRMGNKPYYYDSNNAFPRYENSFYFYFGLNEGKTAIEKFNSKYFAECDNEKGVYNNFNIYKKSSSWCSSLNETYDGFIALDLEKIATPYSIVITGDNTYTLDGITDEKIIFYNDKFYSTPEGFEDYTKRELNNGVIPIIPNGSYYITITDANEDEYHYELDMGYNFLMYSNNVQSFKKNHEDLLRSLGTNNAIMNDNTKLVYSNPEKIEREIGGVITVYGVHDNDGDIEQYKIEVREKVDFDKTDIQKTIKNVGDTWYDKDGNFYEVKSIDGDGTIHYAKNGGTEHHTDKKKGDTVEDYEGMKKELVVPEWYDKNAVKHDLTEKDKNGNYVYEEGAQQADFNPLVKKDMKEGETWYDANGNKYTASSLDAGKTVVDYSDWTLELNLPTYYDKNGEKQYYPYEPNKETSVVDFELTDRLKEVTSIKPRGEEILTVEEWNGLSTEEKTLYEEVYVKEDGEERIIITKEEWESIEDTVEKNKYVKMYCNKYVIIHYTKNGEGDYRGRDTWYDADGVKHTASNSDIGRTLVDYTDWKMELLNTLPTWYDLDGYLCKVTKNVKDGIHYTKNGEGNYTISGRNTITEVIFKSSLETPPYPYLEYLYNLKKGDEYVEKRHLEGSDGVEYGISYKVISPYALTIDEYDNLTEYGKFDYEQKYVNKDDETIITPDDYNQLPDYNQDCYAEAYVNKTAESNIITPEAYNGLSDGYGKNDYKEETTYCKIENKKEYITKDEYKNDESIQSLYQPSHVLKEDKEGKIKILIENGYDKTLNKEDYENIIVTYNAFGTLLDSTNKTEIEFYTKKGEAKKCIYDSTDKRWKYGEINIDGNYIINYQILRLEKNKDEVYYDYEGKQQTVKEETETVLDFTPLVRVLSFDTWLDEDGALCEITSIDTDGTTIYYTKNGEEEDEEGNPYTISGRNTVINYNQPIWTKITRSDDNYSWVDKNGVTQYAGGEKLVVDYSWLLKTITQEEIVWYDKKGNVYKVTSVVAQHKEILTDEQWSTLTTDGKTLYEEVYVNKTDSSIIISKEQWEKLESEEERAKYGKKYRNKYVIIHYTKNGEEKDEYVKEVGDIVVDFNHDSFILILDDIDDAWYDEDGKLYEVTSIDTDGTIHYTMNGEGDYTIDDRNTVVNYYKFMTEPLYLPTWYDVDGNLYKVIKIEGSTIYYTKNGEEKYKEGEEDKPYIIVGRDTVVDWSEYIGYEGAEITYDNGVITDIENVLWYDSEKQSFAFGVPDENRTYVITVTQLCNVSDNVIETSNEIKTNVFVSGVIRYKMFINGIDYEIIKNFDGHTGWSYNGTITKNKLITKVSDLNENNPWFNVDKIYYHDYFEGKDNNKDEYPKINLKDIDRFGIDKDENQQTYRIYATEINKEDEEVGKKVNETYHGEDGKNKTVKANDVIATFVNKRNEDDVTTYKVIHFTVKNLTVVGETWYDADGNLYKVTSIVDGIIHYTKNGEGDYTDKKVGDTVVDYSNWVTELKIRELKITEQQANSIQYVNKQVSTDFITTERYNKLPDGYSQKSYDVYRYVNRNDEENIITKEQWEDLSEEQRDSYEPYTYINKYNDTDIISPEDWGKLPTEYCKGDYEAFEKYFKQYKNNIIPTDFIATETYEQLSKGYSQNSYDVYNYINKQDSSVKTIEDYNKLPDGYSQKSYDVYQYVNETDKEDIITKTEWEGLSEKEREKYEPYKYVNKYDATKFITPQDWDDLPKDYCKRDYEVHQYANKYEEEDIISPEDWVKLPNYCQRDYTQVYLSTWYDKNGTLNYMLPSEEGQKRIDFRPLVKTIEKEGETWYDVNSVKRAAGSDDIGQEVLDYSKKTEITKLKQIYFKTDDKTWNDKNGIENKADSDKLGLYIDITYMTKGDDTILFNIHNEEYIDKLVIDKLVIDKLVVKYVNKQDSSKVIDVVTYNKLPDGYSQNSYDEVYVNRDDETILTKEQWNALESEEKDKYAKMYRNKYDATIISPEDWGKLPKDSCKGDYQLCSAYNFNRKGLHSVRIYLSQEATNGKSLEYQNLLSDAIIDFNGCSDLNTIVLPNIGITTIGANVFNGCKSLTSIDLPDSITTIGNNAFKGCEKLNSVYIPWKVTTIGDSAFNGCKSLTNIVLPASIKKIGDKAFANCEKLQSVRAEMKDVANTTVTDTTVATVASNAFDNTNIGLIIYVPMDKDEKTYDVSTTPYNKAGWGDDVQNKVVAIELTVFNYNKVNINPSDLLDEFARNTGDNKIYYNFIDSYVAGEYKAFTQVTYFKASDFVNTINNVLSRRREIADRMFNTFYMTQEGESKTFNITSNTDETPVQPIIVYHEEEIDDVDIDYTLTTPNLTYEQINMLKNVNIPTITYKSSPFFGDGTSSDDIIITKSNNIEKKPLSTGIMNVKQKSIPLDSGNKDFPSISLSGGVKAINPSKTNIVDLFEFPVIDKIESSSVSVWTKFSNIPSPNPDNIGMINMDGYVYGRHNNGVVERDGKFETRKLGKYEINLSENLNNSTKPYTYAERRVITGLTNYSMAQWCILKLRNIVQADDVTEETLTKIWDMLFNPKNEKGKPSYNKEKLFDVIDTMTVLKQTIDENLVIYIQCDETIDGVKPQWKIDQGEEDYITEKLIQFKNFNVVANKDYKRQYAFTDAKKANLNIGEINENFNFDNELKLSTEVESIDFSGHTTNENLTRLSFNQGEKEDGHYQLFALSRYRDGFYGNEDMNQYPLYNAAKNGIVYQINDVQEETMLSHEGEITKINNKEKQIQGTFNEPYHSSYFHSMYKFKGSNDDERVWRDSESTNGLYISNKNFNNNHKKFSNVSNDYFLDTNYIRHVYCVYVKGNMKMLSPLYEFAPTQLVGTWGQLESYDERDKSVIGIKVNDFARVYFKNYDYTLGGPFNIRRKYKNKGIGWLSYTIPEGTIKYKDEDYYYMIVDKLEDKNYSYVFENNMGVINEYSNFHKDHVIAKDITDLRHLTWTNGNKLDKNNFILIKWKVPESDRFRFINEQKDTETEDFVEKITVEKVYIQGQKLTRLPKNNGQYDNDDKWSIQYKNGKKADDIVTNVLLNMTFDGACTITKQNKN